MLRKLFTESDFEKLLISQCDPYLSKEFLDTLNHETLGSKVHDALEQRKQGHFNKAVASMTEANRDQVVAVREIQNIICKVENRPATEVMLENFRQVSPFQIGLTNGGQVLALLSEIKSLVNDFDMMINDLHHDEKEAGSLIEEYTFFSERTPGRISDKELQGLKENITDLAGKVYSAKSLLLDIIIKFVDEKFSSIYVNDRISMIKCFYIVLTSSIETLDAKSVIV